MMNDNHARARELMLDAAMGDLSNEQTAELMRHLGVCETCRAEQEELAASVSVFKTASVTAPPFLASRTRAEVNARARQLADAEQRRRVIGIALSFDVAWTLLSIWVLFSSVHWFGFAASSSWMWVAAVTWFWLLPALGALMVVSLHSSAHTWQRLGVEGDSHD